MVEPIGQLGFFVELIAPKKPSGAVAIGRIDIMQPPRLRPTTSASVNLQMLTPQERTRRKTHGVLAAGEGKLIHFYPEDSSVMDTQSSQWDDVIEMPLV